MFSSNGYGSAPNIEYLSLNATDDGLERYRGLKQ
ncbi:MAG TPA: hypothetical protein DEB17_06055 [Chlorobaculum sp.]|uniref:Uncharacterized protein n=1 Tax=Chlorobaculum tepidum (strain ATCC 49652 / DSM 12025 / NBRC 103806 / TLS) TaxID=194439 RepID=Q8KF82_CHLTE|nr:hypothetical protein CT0448 [Chlorobaculum tepidum TLS]HBU23545.1 hypothetical protein [Chlorobaculum sp.]